MLTDKKRRCMLSTKILYRVVNKKNIDNEDYEVLVDFIAKLLTSEDQAYFDMFYQYFVTHSCFQVNEEETRFYSVINKDKNHPTDYLYYTKDLHRAFAEALDESTDKAQLIVYTVDKANPLLDLSSIIDTVLKINYSNYRKDELVKVSKNNLYLGAAEQSNLKCLEFINLEG